jgi:hypothetical protein
MFEIYREGGPHRPFRVVFFTDLDAHERDEEIERAMAGEHVFDGFIAARDSHARQRVNELVARLNRGERLDNPAIRAELGAVLA